VVSIKAGVNARLRLRLVGASVADGRRAEMRLVWFHSPYILKHLREGDRVAFAGAVDKSLFRGRPGMVNPQHERLGEAGETPPQRVGGMTPKYHLVEGLTSRKIAGWVELVLPLAGHLEDLLPPEVRERHRLLDVADAVRLGHKPASLEDFAAARKRMTFADLFELQAAFTMMRASIA